MKRDDWERLLLHLPWGLLGAFPLCWWLIAIKTRAVPALILPILLLGIVASFTAVWLMIAYEVVNDWRKVDHSYKDVLGIVWGYLLGIIGIGLWVLL